MLFVKLMGKVLVIALVLALASTTTNVRATGFPSFDTLKNAGLLQEQIAQIEQWMREYEEFKAQIEQHTSNVDLNVKNDNNIEQWYI